MRKNSPRWENTKRDEENGKQMVEKIITSDITHILIIYIIGIGLVAIYQYYKDFLIAMFPVAFPSGVLGIAYVGIFLVLMGFIFSQEYLIFTYFTFKMFTSISLIIILIAIFVIVTFYIAHLIMEKISITIIRSRSQKIAKSLMLWTGIGIGIYITAITFPTSNLFNYNYITWVLCNVQDYIRYLFELVFSISATGLLTGYGLVFISDLLFITYRRIFKKKLIPKIIGHEWTDITEIQIVQNIKKVIGHPPTTNRSKIIKAIIIIIIMLASATIFRITFAKNTTIHIRFSPDFTAFGPYPFYENPINSSLIMLRVGVISGSITPDKLYLLLATQNFSLSSLEYLNIIEFLAPSIYTIIINGLMGGLDFTFDIPKDNNVFLVTMTFLYRMNLTEPWSIGKGIYIGCYGSSIIPKTINLHNLYISKCSRYADNSTQYFGYLLGSIGDSPANLYDYLFKW